MSVIKYKHNREYKTGEEIGDETGDNDAMKFEVYEIENNKENSGENIRNNNRNDIKDNRGNNEEIMRKIMKEDSSLKFEIHECVRGGM